MRDIHEYLEEILTAKYGKDVRQAIHDSIEQMYGSPCTIAYVDGDTLYIASNVSNAEEEEY